MSAGTLTAAKASVPDAAAGSAPGAERLGVLLYVVAPGRYFISHRLPLACAAAAEGWEVHVATPPGGSEDRIAHPAVTAHHLPLGRSIASPLAELRSLWALAMLCRRLRPDLIHAVPAKAAVFAGLVARVMGIRVVIMKGGPGATPTSGGAASAVARHVIRIGVRASVSARTTVVVQNHEEGEDLGRSPNVRARTAIVQGAGVDCAAFHPTPEPPGPVTVVLPARMLACKGVREFVGAARLLAARGVRARFVLAGWLDPSNPTALGADEIGGWVAEGVVEWLGDCTDMPALLTRCHVVCLPSRGEGVPKALAEAAAAGRPIVATDVPGCRDVVQPDVNGLLVPRGDLPALADALETLIRDRGLRARFGRAGRRIALERFDERVIIPRMLGIYRSLREQGVEVRAPGRGMRAWGWGQRALAAALLLPAAALALPAALLIRLGSRGPMLFRQVREGKDGARFAMYKLRTMVAGGEARLEEHLSRDEALREEWAQRGSLARDPRIAGRVARLARRFSVDELPQLLNVLRGEMSLVGPRPLPLAMAAQMSAEDRRCRQAVLPGMTGLWQVSGRSDLEFSDMGRLDREYLRTRAVWRDLGILLRTVWVVLGGNGAY